MKINQILILFIAGFFAACAGNNETVSDTNAATANEIQIKNDTVSSSYMHYIQLKDALVKSDTKAANQAALALAGELKDIQGCENTTKIAKIIANSSDISQQRAQFTVLSSDIIAMMKNTRLSSGTIFVQYCPMANNGEGGYWLASDTTIRNPYYGDEMLDCGEVKEEITTNLP